MRIKWDQDGNRRYNSGLSQGVIYPTTKGVYGPGEPWDGLTAVNRQASGGEPTPLYADNMEYGKVVSAEKIDMTIEAYTYPEGFEKCDGTASPATGVSISCQPRTKFGLVYRTEISNDVEIDYGYELHIAYGCLAQPSERANKTNGESPEAITFSWTASTTPVSVTGYKPTPVFDIDSTKIDPAKLKLIEDALFGTDDTEPKLLTPDEIIAIMNAQ